MFKSLKHGFLAGQDDPFGWINLIVEFIADQECEWPALHESRKQWLRCRSRKVLLDPFFVALQYNSSRERSVSAPSGQERISNKDCFLCFENMPREEMGVAVNEEFAFFLNPYPIFYPHLFPLYV